MVKSFIDSVKIIGGCGIPIFWSGVISFAYPGVMSSYWQEKFNVGNTETGLVVTFMLIALALAMFVSGRALEKIGMSYCTLIGTLLYIVAFTVLFFANSIYWVYVWAFFANLGCSFVYGPGLTTTQRAFPEIKGLISGIMNLLFGIAAAVMSPVLNTLLNNKGYKFVNVLTIILLVTCDLFAYVLVRISIIKNLSNQQKSHSNSEDLTVKQTVKTKEFWLIWFVWIFIGAAGVSMVTLSKSYATAIGRPGVTILTTFNLANGISRIFVGWLTDKIGARITGTVSYALTTIGYFIMPLTTNIIIVGLGAIGIGIGFGTLFTVSGPLAAILFGLTNFGMIYSVIFSAYGLIGGIVGPAVSGMMLEKTDDNYNIVFIYLGVMSLVGTILMYCVHDKKKISSQSKSSSNLPMNESVTVEIECENKTN